VLRQRHLALGQPQGQHAREKGGKHLLQDKGMQQQAGAGVWESAAGRFAC
jgi:hypothetical protein